MSRCIYCNSGGPFSEEHPLTACLGEFAGAPLLRNRVCKSCNTEIGRAEEQFCRASPEALFRAYYGIFGRDFHEKVNPFERGSAGAPAIDFLAVHPQTHAETLWEFNFGEKTVREVRQVVVVDIDGAAHPIRVPQWMRDATELLQQIDALGVRAKEIHIFAAEDETEWLERLTSNLSVEVSWRSSQQSLSIQQAVAQFQVTDKYVRTLAKIGFHYLLAVNPAISGAEQGFAPLRQFIQYGGDMGAFFREESGSIIERPTLAHRPERPIHVVLVEWWGVTYKRNYSSSSDPITTRTFTGWVSVEESLLSTAWVRWVMPTRTSREDGRESTPEPCLRYWFNQGHQREPRNTPVDRY